ncbi:ABC transporter substrate-binding protein [Schaalia naturae]|jgi:multiple sugar transport system substrate-binding protein|uniref:ABC transporter substrate-binding protein n=1 Tax=Schaalia naturae TaxID=635203 RepID=A0ABW2SQ00_9ACTO
MRKRACKAGAVAAASLLAATGMAGCSDADASGSAGASTVTWSTWGTPDELAVFQQFNTEFESRHPDITIDFQPVSSYSDYQSKLSTQLTSHTAPDVFYVGDDNIAAMVDNDVLAPLNDRLSAADSAISSDDFSEDIYRVASRDGQIYGLPNDVNPDAFWYDKTALAAAGITEDPAELAREGKWTTGAFFDMVDKLKAAGLDGAAFWNYWSTTDSIMVSQGGTVYDDSGQYVADKDQTSVDALQKWADEFASGSLIVADELPSGSDSDTLFVTHKLGFLVQGRYTVSTVEGAGLSMDDYDVVGWPTPDGAEGSGGVASSFLAINKEAKDADAAYTFFEEFLSKDGQTLRLKDSGNALPSISGIDSIVTDSAKPANVAALISMRDKGFANFPTEAAVPDLSNSISTDIMLPLYQGTTSAQDALDATAQLVAEQVEK